MRLSTVIFLLFILFSTGCDSNKAETMFNRAMDQSKQGNEEECVNILKDLATNYDNTPAGKKAVQLIDYGVQSSNSSALNQARNFITSLEAYFSDRFHYPNNSVELVDFIIIKEPVPNESAKFSKFVKSSEAKSWLQKRVNVFYTTNKQGNKYEVCAVHNFGTKAYCSDSEEREFFEIADLEGLAKSLSQSHAKVEEVPGLYLLVEN